MDTQDQIALWDASNDASETVYSVTNDASRCVKCGLCIAFCPCNVLEANEGGLSLRGCTSTTAWGAPRVRATPPRALTVECEGDATYDPFADERAPSRSTPSFTGTMLSWSAPSWISSTFAGVPLR